MNSTWRICTFSINIPLLLLFELPNKIAFYLPESIILQVVRKNTLQVRVIMIIIVVLSDEAISV
ncbi:hypothetical protein A6J66_015855 [Yersinia enterocolitica]|nr:hypothetical protein A6J66_015855 [Yersinia enterocolitica]